jgi:hypothetical protein
MKVNSLVKNSILVIGTSVWCGLGFMRGINSHKYSHNKYAKNKDYLYTNSICYGVFGIITYANPFLLPITIYKEIYRLEINIRNLEDEKQTDFYNDLL